MRNWIIGLVLILNSFQLQAQKEIVVLHLNDSHSRIESLPYSDPNYPNIGGVVRWGAYIDEVRNDNKNVFLFHCGDIVQGTPYFNVFKGRAEIAIMNYLHFDAACLGNHEFDYGLDTLKRMIETAQFPFVATNYDFSKTVLNGLTKEYVILHKNGLKIGIIGLGVQPEGLIALGNYKGMKYLDPVETANKTAAYLKEKEGCNLIVCLSHLGYYSHEKIVGDLILAQQSRNIDIILGGHTHTFMEKPLLVPNLDGKEVIINQTGDRGIYIGRLDIEMKEEKNR
jgi:5'-nucleotidase